MFQGRADAYMAAVGRWADMGRKCFCLAASALLKRLRLILLNVQHDRSRPMAKSTWHDVALLTHRASILSLVASNPQKQPKSRDAQDAGAGGRI